MARGTGCGPCKSCSDMHTRMTLKSGRTRWHVLGEHPSRNLHHRTKGRTRVTSGFGVTALVDVPRALPTCRRCGCARLSYVATKAPRELCRVTCCGYAPTYRRVSVTKHPRGYVQAPAAVARPTTDGSLNQSLRAASFHPSSYANLFL